MKKLNEREYELTFSYADDADLDRQVYLLMQDMDLKADRRHCFTEADVRELGADRSW